MADMLDDQMARSQQWVERSVPLVMRTPIGAGNRLRVAATLLELSMEHQKAFNLLVQNGVLGSALALFRPQFETYVRGIWYHHCASEKELEELIAGGEPPRLARLIEDVEKLPQFEKGSLSKLKDVAWRFLCDYTHGGSIQVRARNTLEHIGSSYRPEHIANMLVCSARLSYLAGVALAVVANSHPLMEGLHAAHGELYGSSTK